MSTKQLKVILGLVNDGIDKHTRLIVGGILEPTDYACKVGVVRALGMVRNHLERALSHPEDDSPDQMQELP